MILSVVIPVRDKARFLGPCVGSILSAARQARDVEVILVENGSSDGSDHVVSEWSAIDVVTMRSHARTAGRARNEGAACARGDVLCFLDADVVVPARYVDILAATDSGLIFRDNDPANFARKLDELVSCERRARLGNNGRAAVIREFSWEQDGRRLIQAVDSVLA